MALKKKTIQIDAVHIFNSSNNTINLITCYKPLSLEASPESLVRSLEGTLAKASLVGANRVSGSARNSLAMPAALTVDRRVES